MQILVIGGTRFIGPPVVRRLAEYGHEVTIFNRGATEADLPPNTKRVEGDRKRLEESSEELQRLAPDVVLDMISMNERDAHSATKVFRGIARRIVAISSQDVYRAYDIVRRQDSGPLDQIPLSEDAPLREKLYPYGLEGVEEYEKILVERAVMEDSVLPGTVLRLPMVYGPGDYQHRIFPYLKRMDDGRSAILLEEGMPQWRWTRGYVGNVAHAIALAVTDEKAAGRVYNVGERETAGYAEWVREIGQAAGWDGEVLEVPAESMPDGLRHGGNFAQHLVADTKRIRRELGYTETVSWKETLSRTVEWERSNPPEEIFPAAFDYDAEDAILAEIS